MNEQQLREALRNVPLDGDARERSERVVRAAFREAPRSRSRPRWIGAAVVAGLVLAVMTAVATRTPPDAMARWLRDAVGLGASDAQPLLADVPGGGRLLVGTGRDAWVVAPDGGKRRLGRYAGSSWSPRGLFVVAWRGSELKALEPDGDVRWSQTLRQPGSVRAARWAPGDGYRIAYLAHGSVRIVNGNGTGDRRFADARAGVAPAWRPGVGHVLAYVDPRGRVRVADVDSGRELWRTEIAHGVRELGWAPDGRLLVRAARGLTLLRRDGGPLATLPMSAGHRAIAAAWSPEGEVALVRREAMANRAELVLLDPAGGRERVLFTAPGRLGPIAWSPSGRLLLVSWPETDQWLFFMPGQRRRPVRTVADVAAQFDPGGERGSFPTSVEWTGP